MDKKEPAKRLSRTTLTFYIVALFSVAIALIMISYVAQSKANKQLENLSTQLNEQQTAALGVSQKMENLQIQYDELNRVIDDVRSELGNEQAKTDVVGATKKRMEERDVYARLMRINSLLLKGDIVGAETELASLDSVYGEKSLLGEEEDGFSQDISEQYTAAREMVRMTLEEDATAQETEEGAEQTIVTDSEQNSAQETEQ